MKPYTKPIVKKDTGKTGGKTDTGKTGGKTDTTGKTGGKDTTGKTGGKDTTGKTNTTGKRSKSAPERLSTTGGKLTTTKPIGKPASVTNAEKNAKETCDDCDKAKAAVVAAEIKAKEKEAARVAADAKKESDRLEKIKKEEEAEKLR